MGTTGLALSSFDMFHVGHLSALRQAIGQVDHLVLAVADDDLVVARRGADVMVAAPERVEVLEAFFPDLTIDVVTSDRGVDIVSLHAVDIVFVCQPPGMAAPTTVGSAAVQPLRYDMTTSASLLAALEPEILWAPA